MHRRPGARLARVGSFLFALVLAPAATRAAERIDAGPPILAFRHYGPEQGLESQSIEALQQDREGFLWVGTLDGLFRYDGRSFRRFGRDEGLPSSFVFEIQELPDGTLWVNTRFGPARREGSRFVPLSLEGIDGPTEGYFVSTLAASCDGELLFGARPGLYAVRDGRAVPLVDELRSVVVTALFADCDRKELWTATGPEILRLRGDAIDRFPLVEIVGVSPGNVHNFALSATGDLWARGTSQILRFDRAAGRWERRLPGLPPIADEATLFFDRRGHLWVPTNVGLAHVADVGKEEFELLDKSHGLASDSFAVVFEDREGSIWIGNEAAGIDRWLGRGVWSALDSTSGLSHDVVWGSARGADGALFVGTQAGLDRISPDGRSILRYGAADGLRNAVFAFATSRDGAVWAGAGDGNIYRVRAGSTALEIAVPAAATAGNPVTALALDGAGSVWVGTSSALFRGPVSRPGALTRLEIPGTPLDAAGNRLPEFFFGLLVDRRDRVWAAGEYGLVLFDGETARRFTKADGLRIDFTAYLTEGADGAIWVGYRDEFGLSRIEENAGTLAIRHFGRAEGLASELLFALATDSRGRIWAGSAKGIDRYDGTRWEHFGRADGMHNEDVCQNALAAEADGGMRIGTPTGLLFAHGVEPTPAPPPRTVLLEAALGAGAEAATWSGSGEGPLVSRGRGFVARFAALAFRNESRNRFGYRLEGLDEPEIVTAAGEARFARLPPGSYRFAVRARTGDEPWGPPAMLDLVVRPRFHETGWFLALALGATLAAGALVARARERRKLARARQRAAEIAHEVEARTHDLSELNAALDQRRAELEQLNVRLERESNEDALTGLANRRRFETVLAAELRRAQRSGAPLSLLVADIDLFKSFNDENGHAAGDDCLKRVAGVLQRVAGRAGDLAARLGGEEFVAVLPATDPEGARTLAEAMRRSVHELGIPYSRAGGSFVTVSLGLATWSPGEGAAVPDVRQLFERADHALYRAKSGGRDRVVHDAVADAPGPS